MKRNGKLYMPDDIGKDLPSRPKVGITHSPHSSVGWRQTIEFGAEDPRRAEIVDRMVELARARRACPTG